ncbi:hypothetical protein [Herminiimonas fonticola]|uniref:Uncharacterized protein n=1 Tax=Herminiimonas fonticola TaxID=303380 RepID=A0A4V3BV47_9BURK|nr:hypothetical protein [Herminiimonas fonticola]RBA23656.1 hypothetical protein Hfont_1468 [Herminiimonas fonticola]TDN89658.1 hypothetical protein EV677_1718 [Herminiimonas fonticola]
MKEIAATETQLFAALNRIALGISEKTNGRMTQENIALEAGLSRATFNRYPNVILEYKKKKKKENFVADIEKSQTVEDKHRDVVADNIRLKNAAIENKEEYDKNIRAARQEIFILNQALEMRDKTLAEKDREIAELNKKTVGLKLVP